MLAILVCAWYLPAGLNRWRYLRLTAVEFLLSWPRSTVLMWMIDRLCVDTAGDVCDDLMFHNGYRLFEFHDGRWVMCEGVFK